MNAVSQEAVNQELLKRRCDFKIDNQTHTSPIRCVEQPVGDVVSVRNYSHQTWCSGLASSPVMWMKTTGKPWF